MKEEMLNVNCAKALETSVENHGSENAVKSEVDDIYTPLEEAKEEIWRRWNDKALRKKVEDFLGGDIPNVFKEAPRAVLGRHVATPNFELLHFLNLSMKIELRPLCPEYLRDKFVAKSIDKYYLGMLCFEDGTGKKGGSKLTSVSIIDNFGHSEGKRICDLKTVQGGSLVDTHHRLLHSTTIGEGVALDYFDFSNFFEKNGPSASRYYMYLFSLFICCGVLFENYLLDRKQEKFTKETVIPNFRKTFDVFGVQPLIVPLGPGGDEENVHWRRYPGYLKQYL